MVKRDLVMILEMQEDIKVLEELSRLGVDIAELEEARLDEIFGKGKGKGVKAAALAAALGTAAGGAMGAPSAAQMAYIHSLPDGHPVKTTVLANQDRRAAAQSYGDSMRAKAMQGYYDAADRANGRSTSSSDRSSGGGMSFSYKVPTSASDMPEEKNVSSVYDWVKDKKLHSSLLGKMSNFQKKGYLSMNDRKLMDGYIKIALAVKSYNTISENPNHPNADAMIEMMGKNLADTEKRMKLDLDSPDALSQLVKRGLNGLQANEFIKGFKAASKGYSDLKADVDAGSAGEKLEKSDSKSSKSSSKVGSGSGDAKSIWSKMSSEQKDLIKHFSEAGKHKENQDREEMNSEPDHDKMNASIKYIGNNGHGKKMGSKTSNKVIDKIQELYNDGNYSEVRSALYHYLTPKPVRDHLKDKDVQHNS